MRRFWYLALVLVMPATADAEPAERVHVRTSEPYIAELIAEGTSQSATFRHLVDTLNATDVVVYVQFMPRRSSGSPLAGYLIDTIVKAGDYRYLRAILDRHQGGRENLVAVLAHELQHVIEVATAPDVRNSEGFQALFARIGLTDGCTGVCETAAAGRVQRQVARELRDARIRVR